MLRELICGGDRGLEGCVLPGGGGGLLPEQGLGDNGTKMRVETEMATIMQSLWSGERQATPVVHIVTYPNSSQKNRSCRI